MWPIPTRIGIGALGTKERNRARYTTLNIEAEDETGTPIGCPSCYFPYVGGTSTLNSQVVIGHYIPSSYRPIILSLHLSHPGFVTTNPLSPPLVH